MIVYTTINNVQVDIRLIFESSFIKFFLFCNLPAVSIKTTSVFFALAEARASNTTADVLRPALQIVKAQPHKKIVTGSTPMLKNGCTPLLYGDVSLIENPDSQTLAQIAISNAEFKQICGEEHYNLKSIAQRLHITEKLTAQLMRKLKIRK